MAGEDDNAMLGVMDEGMHEARHDGRYRRIEVITRRCERRDWTDEQKARIVCESAEPDANISAVARRYGVYRGLLNAWRREAGLTRRRVDKALVQEPAFVPVNVVGGQASQRAISSERAHGGTGRIEIALDGARITVVGSVEPKLAQFLPPRSPELNPVENVWHFMRDNWLANRIFKDYHDIVTHCYAAWNKLVDQPWKIMSIGLRDWAHQS